MDYSDFSEDEFSDIGSGSDVESEEEEVESEVNVSSAFFTPQLVPQQREALATKKRCGFCNRDADRKTSAVCGLCETPVCTIHSYIVCRDCMDVVEEEDEKMPNFLFL